jgi:thiol-disulfide isomerase/thioredoxin
MRRFFYIFLVTFFTQFSLNAQLPDGAIAPDFTVTDIDGNSHNLYSYLNSGIHVVLDFSATWCGPCWSYHNTHRLRDLYDQYGPNGTNQVMVIFMESENNNSMQCLYGNGGACTGVYPNSSQGNWVVNTTYPIVDLSSIGQNSLKSAYQISYYPTLYAINHHTKKIYEVGQPTLQGWLNWLFGSFEMAVTTQYDNSNPCPLTASITATTTAGAPPISYSWSNGATTSTISNLASGTYRCTVSDNNQFQIVTEPVVINSPPAINITLQNSENLSCFESNNGEISVNASGGNSGFSYEWSNGQSGPTITNLPAGSYSVVVTDVMGCTKQAGPYNITQPALLQTSVNLTNPSCGMNNGIVGFLASGGTYPYEYTLGTTTQSSPTFTNLAGGTYNYTIVDDHGCNVSGTETLLNSTAPIAQTSSIGSISCINTTAQVSGVGSSTGSQYEYTWTTTNGNIVSGANDLVAVVSQGGTYNLQVRNINNGCISNSSTLMAANTTLPTALATTPGELNCTVSSLNLSGNGSSSGNNFTYLWTTANGNITAGATTLTPTVNQAGSYNLKVTNTTNGCFSNASTSVVLNNTPPSLNIPANAELNCSNPTAQLCATSNASSFLWSNGQSTECISVSTPGSYSLVATGSNGCTSSASSVVTSANDLPDVNIAAPGMVTCTVPTVTLQGSVASQGQHTYLWTTTDGTIVSGADSPNAVVSSAGSYTLKATNTLTGCVGQETVTVNALTAAPPADYTSTENNGTLTAAASVTAPSTSFEWKLNNNVVGSNNNITLDISSPGTYNLCLRATNDCGSNEICNTFTVLAPLSVTITGTEITCYGSNDGTATATAIGGKSPYTYAWSGPNNFTASTSTITGLSIGTYTVVINDDTGATITSSVTIGQAPALDMTSSNIVNDINNANSGSIDIEVGGGTGSYNYAWSNGATTQDLNGIGAGSYTCVITDANGCTKMVGPFVVSNVSNVDEALFVQSLSIYPNPAVTTININAAFKKFDFSEVKLMNTLGQVMFYKSYSGDINDRIDISSLNSGVYNISITSGEHITWRKVLVTK